MPRGWQQWGLLKAVDAFNFAVWCCLAAEFEKDAERMTAARIAQMRQVGERFGLDAGARAKLAVTAEHKIEEEDPADKYLNRPALGSNLQ